MFFLSTATHLAADRLPAQMIMTQEQRAQMGFDKLTPQEKQAFESWVGGWTARVLEQAPSYRPGMNISSWVQSWPGHANPTKTEFTEDEIQDRQQSNQIVDRIRDNGQFVDLQDGSSWQVSPFFRYLTTTWQKRQTIEVRRGTNQLHPWLLHNINLDQVAEANIAQAPSPTGKKEQEPPEYYSGSVPMQTVTDMGDLLTLGNGTVWKVAPTDQYKAKNWSPSDRIKVEPSDNYLYKYRITNLDNGEVLLGNPRK